MDELFRVFMVYVASSGRPMHELLGSTTEIDEHLHETQFVGMTREAVSIETFRDTEHRQVLMEVIDAGCKRREYGRNGVVHYYVCPPAAGDPDIVYLNYRAGFEYSDGRWIFRFFIAGD